MLKFLIILLTIISNTAALFSADILSQWRGAERDGIYRVEGLLSEWPDGGPELLWRVDGLGIGFSSPAVANKRVYVTAMIDGTGYLFAFDWEGKQIWKKTYGNEWDGGRPGARTTPTVLQDRIYLFSGYAKVVCLDMNADIVWQVDAQKAFGARNLRWGITESLLVDGDRLFCTPGGRNVMVAALDRHTGTTIWTSKGNGEASSYCSPVLVNHNNRPLLLTMTGKSVVGLDANNGKMLWEHSHVTSYDINPNTPLYKDGRIFTVSGYGTGGQMFELSKDGNSIKRLWAQDAIDSQMGAAVLVDGYIYGSGQNNRGWHCLDWRTGKVMYSARELGNKGNIIFAGGLLYLYGEKGDVALVRPNPQELDVISSFKIKEGSGPHWAHPVIDNGRLFVRHGDVMMVYDIGKK
jgi:outer membrane protein assembly factor BamB